MIIKISYRICLFLFLSNNIIFAQQKTDDLRWPEVVLNQPNEWYGTAEAVEIAENVLLYQRDIGGWPKNLPLHHELTSNEKAKLLKLKKNGIETTIDNGATFLELTYLSKVYNKTKTGKYKEAFLKGINYLLDSQYANGGWPQFYPLK